MTDAFDPADAGCWAAHDRPSHHALALADAWQRFPDLPVTAPLDERMARTRERVLVLRPLHEAMSAETEAARQCANFAWVERRLASGGDDPRHSAILRGRDAFGYDWNAAWSYAEGFHAARAGWEARCPGPHHAHDAAQRREAYDRGFRDGGGRPEDLFDVARRAFAATPPEDANMDSAVAGRPLPSQWPSPTDIPSPASWHRRLLLVGAAELATGAIGVMAMLRERLGYEAAAVLVIDAETGLRPLSVRELPAPFDGMPLCQFLGEGDFTDILVVADASELERLDADADLLPLTRTRERTRNSLRQQHAQFRLWLARGRSPGEQFAAGHIRWSKMAAGLSGRLGDFTARYAGAAEPRGHRIVVEDASGMPARGYRTAMGAALDPEIVIGNKRHARAAIADLLRQFAASLRLG